MDLIRIKSNRTYVLYSLRIEENSILKTCGRHSVWWTVRMNESARNTIRQKSQNEITLGTKLPATTNIYHSAHFCYILYIFWGSNNRQKRAFFRFAGSFGVRATVQISVHPHVHLYLFIGYFVSHIYIFFFFILSFQALNLIFISFFGYIFALFHSF